MGEKFRKVLVSLMIAGQLSLTPAKSLANELKSFKNYSEQNNSMPVMKEQPVFSSAPEVRKEIDFLMGQKDKKIPKKLHKYSTQQKAQLAAHMLFDFYQLSPGERAESEKGKKLYYILVELYHYKDEKGFGDAFSKEITSNLEKENPDAYVDFVSLFDEYYSYEKGEIEEDRAPIGIINYLLEGYDRKEAAGIVPKPAKTISLLTVITDKTLKDFVSEFSKDYAELSREDAIEVLANEFINRFNTTDSNAKMLLKAVLYTYSSLEGKDRKLFMTWFRNMDEKQSSKLIKEVEKASYMKKTTLPTEVVREMFEEVKLKKKDKEKYEEELKKELDKYPSYVRITDLEKLTKKYERVPNSTIFGRMFSRLEYVEKKIEYLEFKDKLKPKEKKELKELKKELKHMDKWLDKFGLSSTSPMAKLTELDKLLVQLQAHYLLLSTENLGLVDFVTKTEPPALRDLFLLNLIGLDAVSARVFTDIDTTGDLEKQMYDIIKEKYSYENINNAKITWSQEYLEPFNTVGQDNQMLQILYSYMGFNEGWKSPMLIMAFSDYYKQAKTNGVTSPEERELVMLSSMKLATLHPLLVIKYFNAIRHLSDICKGNPGAYMEALYAISARVDSSTSAVFSPETGFQMATPTMERTVQSLSNGFEAILAIDEASLTQYNRYDLVDNNLYVDDFTNVITQKPPQYIQPLTQGKEQVGKYLVPSPFPHYLDTVPHQTPFSGGTVGLNQQSYESQLTMPQIQPVWVPSGAQQALASVENYLFDEHKIMTIDEQLPGTEITGLSVTELLKNINAAFIHNVPLEYEITPISGGGAVGAGGKDIKGAPDEHEAMGLASWITPTGGWAAGGNYKYPGHEVFAGGNAVALPMGTISKGIAKGTEVGIESFAGGFENLEEGAQSLLIESIANAWDPENPSDTFINVNYEKTFEDKAWMTSRLFYVDKAGRVFELKGGYNEYVNMFNFIAGSFDELGNKQAPVLGVYNYEPTVETVGKVASKGTGGFALAFDASKTSWMFHFQSVPFLSQDQKARLSGFDQSIAEKNEELDAKINELDQAQLELEDAIEAGDTEAVERLRELIGSDTPGEESGLYGDILELEQDIESLRNEKQSYTVNEVQQPMLLEWTPGVAWTKEKPEKEKTNIYELTFPGKLLKMQASEAGEITGEDVYALQDVVIKVREVEGAEASELTIGMGLGGLSKHWVDEVGNVEGAVSAFGRGGIYYKSQKPKVSWGLGAYLDRTPDFEAMAMLSDSENMVEYVESLWKIGTTVYGKGEIRNNVFLGGLGHIMEQLRPEETEDGKRKWDAQTFLRFVGFLKGIDNVMKLEVARFEGYENLMTDYQGLMTNVRQNPQNAGGMISNFQNQYENMIDQIYDEYYLGVNLNKDFSLEAKLVFKEEDKDWTKQIPQNIQAKALATWDSGFWRLYASIPTWMPSAVGLSHEGEDLADRAGLVGTGFGFDVFNNYFLQRVAFDAGAILAFDEVSSSEVPGLTEKEFKKPGAFAQAAVILYSDVLEMSKQYRKLVTSYEKYEDALENGEFSKIPEEVTFAGKKIRLRDMMCDGIGEDVISPEVLNKIRNGEEVIITEMQKEALSDSLWQWFYDEKTLLEEKFNGKVNTYLAGDMYLFNKDKIYWDIGFFFEYVDAVKAYIILAEREKLGLYSGMDIQIDPDVVVSATANVTLEKEPEVSAGLSMKIKAGPGWFSTHFYLKSANPPVYSHPAYVPYQYNGQSLEWSLMMYYTIGFGAGTPVQFNTTHTPAAVPTPWWQQGY